MITIESMTWSNYFSYGKDNKIDFTVAPVVQLLGNNGDGKSSIPLILEEALYGKNSKGFKKADIPNRYLDESQMRASVSFRVNEDAYRVDTARTKTGTSVTLFKNGKSISGNTATATLKTLEEIIGREFKIFSQLIYQSSTSSLSFLTSTDSERKKFLVALFNQEKYNELCEFYKQKIKDMSAIMQQIQGSLNTIKLFIDKAAQQSLDKQELKEEPVLTDNSAKLKELSEALGAMKAKAAAIEKNNKVRDSIAKLKEELGAAPSFDEKAFEELKNSLIVLKSRKSQADEFIKKFSSLNKRCPTCLSEITEDRKKESLDKLSEAKKDIEQELHKLESSFKTLEKAKEEYSKYIRASTQLTNLTNQFNDQLPESVNLDLSLEKEISKLQKEAADLSKQLSQIREYNNKVLVHNASIDKIVQQRSQFEQELVAKEQELSELTKVVNRLEILKRTFGTNGLIAYVLESLVKELETTINKYLSYLSSGAFAIKFQLKADKLDITILDGVNEIPIVSLSAGELARVNVSTVLAIRSMLSSISGSQINLLFLDEVMGVLDLAGKERLVELLQKERNLNTLIVDHSYTHPLIPIIKVIKQDNISRIEHG